MNSGATQPTKRAEDSAVTSCKHDARVCRCDAKDPRPHCGRCGELLSDGQRMEETK